MTGPGPQHDPFPRDPLADPETGLRIPESQIDAMLDGDLTRDQSRDMFRRLMGDPVAGRELAQTEAALEALRRPVTSPDFTRRILNEVDRRRAWLPAGGVRKLTAWRLAAAIALLGVLAGGFALQRTAPRAVALVDQPAPITDLARAVSYEAAGVFTPVQQTVRSIRAELMPTPAPEVAGPAPTRVLVEWRCGSKTGDAAADALAWLDDLERGPCAKVGHAKARAKCCKREPLADGCDWSLAVTALSADRTLSAGASPASGAANAILPPPGR